MFELFALSHDGSDVTDLYGVPIDGIRSSLRRWLDGGAKAPLLLATHHDSSHLHRLRDTLMLHGIQSRVTELPQLEPVPPPLMQSDVRPASNSGERPVSPDSGLYAIRSGASEAMPFPSATSAPPPVRTGMGGGSDRRRSSRSGLQPRVADSGRTRAFRTGMQSPVSPGRQPTRTAPPTTDERLRLSSPSAFKGGPQGQPIGQGHTRTRTRTDKLDVLDDHGQSAPPTDRMSALELPTDRLPSATTSGARPAPHTASSSGVLDYRKMIAEQEDRRSTAAHVVASSVGWIRPVHVLILAIGGLILALYRAFTAG